MEDWDIVKQNAKIAKQAKTVFQSFVQQRLYRINKILEDRILIDRVSGGKPAAFKKQEVVDAINTLKKTKRVKKDALLNSVVREVLLVRLHPDVAWDEKTHELYWKPDPHQLIVNKVQDLIPEAPDDQLEKVYTLIAQRRHQNKFRKALMKLYGNKCAISGCDVDVVLQAAHISRYASSGINSNSNGIILRNDLHTLFDNNLLVIHPITLLVKIHSKLRKSDYWKFDGTRVSNRSDRSNINKKYLEERWASAEWVNKKRPA